MGSSRPNRLSRTMDNDQPIGMRPPRWLWAAASGTAVVLLLVVYLGAGPQRLNGFDVSTHNVPIERIVSGGPGKDGIPALSNPRFLDATAATFLDAEDRVLGITRGSEAKVYPIKILNWHEIVNDRLGRDSVTITYCPLCGTGIGFDARVDGKPHSFGVSGLLYESDLLMYDRETESLWSQIAMEAVAGPLTGSKLTPIFLEHTTWHEWLTQHPSTKVLSPHTGFSRDYDRDPYLGYAERPELMYDTTHFDPSYLSKEWVLGVVIDGVAKAYPFSELQRVPSPVTDKIGEQHVLIHFNPHARSAKVTHVDGQPLPSVMAYWFAWTAFHPQTEVFRQPK